MAGAGKIVGSSLVRSQLDEMDASATAQAMIVTDRKFTSQLQKIKTERSSIALTPIKISLEIQAICSKG